MAPVVRVPAFLGSCGPLDSTGHGYLPGRHRRMAIWWSVIAGVAVRVVTDVLLRVSEDQEAVNAVGLASPAGGRLGQSAGAIVGDGPDGGTELALPPDCGLRLTLSRTTAGYDARARVFVGWRALE